MMSKQTRMTILGLAGGFLGLALLLGHEHFDGFRFAHPVTTYQWGYGTGQTATIVIMVVDLVGIAILLLRLRRSQQ